MSARWASHRCAKRRRVAPAYETVKMKMHQPWDDRMDVRVFSKHEVQRIVGVVGEKTNTHVISFVHSMIEHDNGLNLHILLVYSICHCSKHMIAGFPRSSM